MLSFVAVGFPPEADAPMAHSLRWFSHPEGCGYKKPLLFFFCIL
jgi:hypothetical protein